MIKITKNEIIDKIKYNLNHKMVLEEHDCTIDDVYLATVDLVKELISYPWKETKDRFFSKKKIFYLSFEYLPERFLDRNLVMLGLKNEFKNALSELGYNLDEILDMEVLGKLGDGTLGRFAFSFIDSASSSNTNVFSYGMRYANTWAGDENINLYSIDNGNNCIQLGFPWEYRRNNLYDVNFKDFSVQGQAYDIPVVGYEKKAVNTLRLWSVLDNEFVQPQAFIKDNIEEICDKLLKTKSLMGYLDNESSNLKIKKLRIRQEYFYSTCSIKDILFILQNENINLEEIDKYVNIKLNENHTLMSIPVFIKEYSELTGFNYNTAYEKAKKIFNYTAFENFVDNNKFWSVDLIKEICPDILEPIEFINNEVNTLLNWDGLDLGNELIDKMQIINNNKVNFTNIALHVASSINAVSSMHYKIITDGSQNGYSNISPKKYGINRFGVSQRTWLYIANKELSNYLCSLINKDIIKYPEYFINLENYKYNQDVQYNIEKIKNNNKLKVEKHILEKYNISINPYSIYDMQLKNFEEHRRQILSAFYITKIYFDLLENSNLDILERTYFFGGVSSVNFLGGNYVIDYILELAKIINSNLRIKNKIKIVFIGNITMNESMKLIPSADINEQISTPGLDIAGVSAIKYMFNGGLTIGSRTGLNLDIRNEIDEKNIFLFGKSQEDAQAQFKYNFYNPEEYVLGNEDLRNLIANVKTSSYNELKNSFENLYKTIMKYNDSFMVFRDFSSYIRKQEDVDMKYRNRSEWNSMQIVNIANSGKFSVDYSVESFKNIINKEN